MGIVPWNNWNPTLRGLALEQGQIQLIGLPRREADRFDQAQAIAILGTDCVADTTGPAILSRQKLVFVVDDDPGILRGVRRLLRRHGYDSVLFPSAEAFQTYDNFEQAICVVLDIHLNNDSGIELCHRLKAAGSSLPVIYMTGKDSDATRMAAMASGCIAYLTKPFTGQSLIEPIERAFAALA